MAENPRTTPGIAIALTIAGSDSSGGAGIQADLKTFAVMGVHGASAITAITAQNTTGVKAAHPLEPKLIEQQIDAVAGDFDIDATKTGMLADEATVKIVARAVKRQALYPLVVDPVMVAKSGDKLVDDDAVRAITQELFPEAALVTPNRYEAARLLGYDEPIENVAGAEKAAQAICRRFGAAACIIKGIRRPDEHEGQAVDVYFNGQECVELTTDWRPTENTHGSGCTFAAAITAGLALGKPMGEAVETAKTLIHEAIRQSPGIGQGRSPVNHLAWLKVK